MEYPQIRQLLRNAENGVLSRPANSDDHPARKASIALHECKVAIWRALDKLAEAEDNE